MRFATICFESNQGYITARKETGERENLSEGNESRQKMEEKKRMLPSDSKCRNITQHDKTRSSR
jgi:hypothetical protein